MNSVDLMSLCDFVCSVLLCNSVRKRTHPLYEMTHMQLGGGVFSLSHWGVLFLTEHTDFTESFSACFDSTRGGDSIYLALAKIRVNGRVVGSCEQKNRIKTC